MNCDECPSKKCKNYEGRDKRCATCEYEKLTFNECRNIHPRGACNMTYPKWRPKKADRPDCKNYEPVMPDGSVRLGDLKVGELWVIERNNADSGVCVKRVAKSGTNNISRFLMDEGKTHDNPDTPVYRVKAVYSLQEEE